MKEPSQLGASSPLLGLAWDITSLKVDGIDLYLENSGENRHFLKENSMICRVSLKLCTSEDRNLSLNENFFKRTKAASTYFAEGSIVSNVSMRVWAEGAIRMNEDFP